MLRLGTNVIYKINKFAWRFLFLVEDSEEEIMNFAEKWFEEDLMQDYEMSYVKKAPKSLYLKDIDEKKGYNYDNEYISYGAGCRKNLHGSDCLPYIHRIDCDY